MEILKNMNSSLPFYNSYINGHETLFIYLNITVITSDYKEL